MNWINYKSKKIDATKIVLETLKKSGEPLKGGELAEKTGLDKKEIDKAIKLLIKEQLIDSPKRCYYKAK